VSVISRSTPDGSKAPATRSWWTAPDGVVPPSLDLRLASEHERILASRVERQTTVGHFRIPQIPEVAARAMGLLAKPDADTNEISKVIHEDQQLAADMIAFSNSSLFAGATKTTNIPQAINRVGFRRTRSLIFAASLRALVYSGSEVARAERLWRHAIGCGAIAARIAENVRFSADDAYLAGLFHDVGKTVVLSVLDTIAVRAQKLPLRPEFVEHVLTTHHERVGAEVAKHWVLPAHVQEAVALHSENGRELTLGGAVVALANNCCHRLQIGETEDGRAIAGPCILGAFGAEERDLPQILDGVLDAAIRV
jgi:putative nucleotidyltransferase with HDIG domain